MKYLIKRENFVRSAKYSETKSDFLREKSLGIGLYEALLQEEAGWDSHGNTGGGSGPLANDIGWNDSLVGRLINHMIRKAKVAYKLKRIDSVISSLKFEMNRIVDESELAKLDEEDQKLLARVILSEFYAALKKAVEEGYKVEVLKNLTEACIEQTEETEEIEEADKKKLLEELNKFLEFLKQFKEDEGKEDPSISEGEEEGEGKKDDGVLEPETAERLEQSFPTMVSNLNSLYGILITYKSVVAAEKNTAPARKGSAYQVQPGDTVKKIQANTAVNKKKLDINGIRTKNPSLKGIGDDEDLAKKNIKELVLESLILEDRAVSKEKIAAAEASQKIAGGRTATVVGQGESHAKQALQNLNTAIKTLTSEDKGVAITAEFVKALIDNVKNTENKNLIKSLYNEINVCLKGKRKATIQEPSPLYKESYDYLTHRTKDNKKGGMLPAVAEKLARFAKRAMQFDGENLYGSLGELGKHLQKFVETIKANLKANIVEDKPEAKKKEGEKKEGEKKEGESKPNESRLVGYSKFLMIREADDDQKIAAGDPPSGSAMEKIQDFFDKNCMTVKEYVLEKTEYEKLKANIEKTRKESEGAIVLGGFDPVIEIMKLFNKAYKLYMEDFISKRTNFDPSKGIGTGTAAEYDKVGDAYRNKKIFDKWESAVQDILKDRKYQQIFSPKTKLRVGDEMREKAGANLRKFMTDLLDGDSLYSSGGSSKEQGAQAKLFDKYFGNPDDAAKAALENNGAATKEEGQQTGQAAQDAMAGALSISLSKKENVDIKSRTFFAIKAKNKDGDTVQYSFYISDVESEICYLHLASNFANFKKYLDGFDGPKKTLKNGEYELRSSDISKKISFLRTEKKQTIKELLLRPGKIKMKVADQNKDTREIELEVVQAYWLCNEESKEVYRIPEDAKAKLNEAIRKTSGVGNAPNLLTQGLTKVERAQ